MKWFRDIDRWFADAVLPNEAALVKLARRLLGTNDAALRTALIQHRTHMQALNEAAPGDRRGEVFNGEAGLYAPDIRLAQDQLTERYVT